MHKFIILDINIFAIIILCFLMYNYRHSLRFGSLSEKFFAIVIISNISLLFSDLVATALNGVDGIGNFIIIYIFKILFFASCLVLCISWLYFYITRINRMERLDSVFLKYILPIPFVIFILFLLLTVKLNTIFEISSSNEYLRGDFFHISTIIGFFYIVIAFVFILAKRKILAKGEFFSFVVIPLFAIILGILQSLIEFETLFVWPALAIVSNGIHINVLDKKISTDHLTGLNNRLELDSYLRRITREHIQNNQSLGIIMIDVNSFKKINDDFGHVEGDKAIKSCANILRKSMRGSSFVARYGGDEFSIVISECNEDRLSNIIDAINNQTDIFNNDNQRMYSINFSIGYEMFSGDNLLSIDNMIHHVDELMYKNKKAMK